MARHRLPYVQRRQIRDGSFRFRGWALDRDRRVFGRWRDSEQVAYADACAMRKAGPPQAVQTLFDACETVLDELRAKRTKGTVRWYADHFRALQRLIDGETCISRIGPETVEQFVRDRLAGAKGRKVKPATVNSDLRALHRVFAVAIRRGIVRDNPVRRVDRPRADRPALDWFTDAEFRAVLQRIADQHHRDVLLLFALTGVRRSEAARLEPGHVRLRLRQLVVPGKNATRVVPIAPDLVPALERLLALAGPHLLPGGVHGIDDVFRAARDACGDRRMHPHALRHTCGTALVRSGVRPDVVMRLLGHRSITTTMRYVHEVGEDGEKAVRLLRFLPGSEASGDSRASTS